MINHIKYTHGRYKNTQIKIQHLKQTNKNTGRDQQHIKHFGKSISKVENTGIEATQNEKQILKKE